jgi:hypothetical protein
MSENNSLMTVESPEQVIFELFRQEGLTPEACEVLVCLMLTPDEMCPTYYFTDFETQLTAAIEDGWVTSENDYVLATSKAKKLMSKVSAIHRLSTSNISDKIH